MASGRKKTPELERILDLLDEVRPSAGGWSACCPSHDDTAASMSIKVGENGAVIMNCHRGCTTQEQVSALGLQMKDLYPPKERKKRVPPEAFYDYTDEEGNLLYQVLRVNDDGKKSFRQRTPTGVEGQWKYTLGDVRRVLYRLPRVMEAIEENWTIFVVEGEKDVHTLETAGFVATCNSGGAGSGKWLPEFGELLGKSRGKIVVIADRDEAGLAHAQLVVESIGAGPEVKALWPVERYGSKADVSDVIADLGPDWSQGLEPIPEGIVLSEEDDGMTEGDAAQVYDWMEFATLDIAQPDWVIPELLGEGERVILVAPEGVGKSMLARQIALMSSAGIHPFRRTPIPPVRTLYLDLENPAWIINKTSRRIIDSISLVHKSRERDGTGVAPIDAKLLLRPDGYDLLDKKERDWVEGHVRKYRPQLLVISPLYKTYIASGESSSSEERANRVSKFLDYIRSTYDCALWIEHHAPFGSGGSRDLRPFGASLWMRWPEFGLSMQLDPTNPQQYLVKGFRGMRDERPWPKTMTRSDTWPFVATEYYD